MSATLLTAIAPAAQAAEAAVTTVEVAQNASKVAAIAGKAKALAQAHPTASVIVLGAGAAAALYGSYRLGKKFFGKKAETKAAAPKAVNEPEVEAKAQA